MGYLDTDYLNGGNALLRDGRASLHGPAMAGEGMASSCPALRETAVQSIRTRDLRPSAGAIVGVLGARLRAFAVRIL